MNQDILGKYNRAWALFKGSLLITAIISIGIGIVFGLAYGLTTLGFITILASVLYLSTCIDLYKDLNELEKQNLDELLDDER